MDKQSEINFPWEGILTLRTQGRLLDMARLHLGDIFIFSLGTK